MKEYKDKEKQKIGEEEIILTRTSKVEELRRLPDLPPFFLRPLSSLTPFPLRLPLPYPLHLFPFLPRP